MLHAPINETALRALGWHVVTIWEFALKKKSDLPWLVAQLPELVGTSRIGRYWG